MKSNGDFLNLTFAGESHGSCYVGIIEGLPSNFAISLEEIQSELDYRKPNGAYSTQRLEKDELKILSGYHQGRTTGAPLAFQIENQKQQSKDYDLLQTHWRPGHADVVRDLKFSHNHYEGGGHFSARATVADVVIGAFAKKMLRSFGIEVFGYVSQIGELKLDRNITLQERSQINASPLRVPDAKLSTQMEHLLQKIMAEQNSVGSRACITITGCPLGLGEPHRHKVNALLSQAFFSIPATVSVGFGNAESAPSSYGDTFHDEIVKLGPDKLPTFASNNHGGILGGMTTGADILCHIALKPPASFSKKRNYWNKQKNCNETLSLPGRFDPVLAPRFVPVGEAKAALIILNLLYQHLGQEAIVSKLYTL